MTGRLEQDACWPVPELRVVKREAHEPAGKLRAVAFNANGGRDLAGILKCLRRPPLAGADVILLCDVDWLGKRSGYREIAREIAAVLRMSFAYAPKYRIEGPCAAPVLLGGNAILSSQPLADVSLVPLTVVEGSNAQSISRRYGLLASAVFNGRRILLGVLHLTAHSSPTERWRQMDEFLAALPLDVPALIGGDFNTSTVDLSSRWALAGAAAKMLLDSRRFRSPEQREPLFKALREAGFDLKSVNDPCRPTFTFTGAIPRFLRPKLDWVAVRGLSAVPGSASVVPARRTAFSGRVSDHDFLMCEVQV
jgi:endonuclease/exonuclease/phosphatase family metal-dependent hydrolase